jgi:hypothetical protein
MWVTRKPLLKVSAHHDGIGTATLHDARESVRFFAATLHNRNVAVDDVVAFGVFGGGRKLDIFDSHITALHFACDFIIAKLIFHRLAASAAASQRKANRDKTQNFKTSSCLNLHMPVTPEYQL